MKCLHVRRSEPRDAPSGKQRRNEDQRGNEERGVKCYKMLQYMTVSEFSYVVGYGSHQCLTSQHGVADTGRSTSVVSRSHRSESKVASAYSCFWLSFQISRSSTGGGGWGSYILW